MGAAFAVEIAPTGYASLEAIKEKRVLREIARAIDGLAERPEAQGNALIEPLRGLRSVRA